jgi:hypothetical protein
MPAPYFTHSFVVYLFFFCWIQAAEGVRQQCDDTRRRKLIKSMNVPLDTKYKVFVAADTHIFAYFEPENSTGQQPRFTFDSCHDGSRDHPNFRVLDNSSDNAELKKRIDDITEKYLFGTFTYEQIKVAIHRNSGVFRKDYHAVTNNCANRVIGMLTEINADGYYTSMLPIHSYVTNRLEASGFASSQVFDASTAETLYRMRGTGYKVTSSPDTKTILSNLVSYTMVSESICGSKGLFHLDLSSDIGNACKVFTKWGAGQSFHDVGVSCSQFCTGGTWGQASFTSGANDFVAAYEMNGHSPWKRMYGPNEGTHRVQTIDQAKQFCSDLHGTGTLYESELASYSDLCAATGKLAPLALAHLSEKEVQAIHSDNKVRWVPVNDGIWVYLGNDSEHGSMCSKSNQASGQDHSEYVLCRRKDRTIPRSDREECEISRKGDVVAKDNNVHCSYLPHFGAAKMYDESLCYRAEVPGSDKVVVGLAPCQNENSEQKMRIDWINNAASGEALGFSCLFTRESMAGVWYWLEYYVGYCGEPPRHEVLNQRFGDCIAKGECSVEVSVKNEGLCYRSTIPDSDRLTVKLRPCTGENGKGGMEIVSIKNEAADTAMGWGCLFTRDGQAASWLNHYVGHCGIPPGLKELADPLKDCITMGTCNL